MSKTFTVDADGVFEVVDPAVLDLIAGGALRTDPGAEGGPNFGCTNMASCGPNMICQIK